MFINKKKNANNVLTFSCGSAILIESHDLVTFLRDVSYQPVSYHYRNLPAKILNYGNFTTLSKEVFFDFVRDGPRSFCSSMV